MNTRKPIIAAALWLAASGMSMAPIRLYADAMPDPPVEQAPDLTSEESPVVAKARNFVVVPIPLSNPTLGTGLVVGGAYFYIRKRQVARGEVKG